MWSSLLTEKRLKNALTDEIHTTKLQLNSSGSQEIWEAVDSCPSRQEEKADRSVFTFWGERVWIEDPSSPASFHVLWGFFCQRWSVEDVLAGSCGDEDHVWDVRGYCLYDSEVTAKRQLSCAVIHRHAGQAMSLVPGITRKTSALTV